VSEYADARAALLQAGRRIVAAGLVVGSGGNLSARVGDRLLVTPSGSWLDDLDELSVVALDGSHLDGPTPTSELALHVSSYSNRPDVTSVVHAHPQGVLLLDALELGVPVLATTDHAFYVREVRRVGFHPPGSAELAEAAGAALDGCDCVVLARHGCSVVATDVELAVKRALNLEEAARLTLAALAVGRELPPAPRDVRYSPVRTIRE
jgi:L-fuculose-phosphate aldolase